MQRVDLQYKRRKIRPASDPAASSSLREAAWQGEYNHIDTQDKSLALPIEIWNEINNKLLPRAQSQFAQVARGAYALGYVSNNGNAFYNRFIRARREQVKALLFHVIRGEKKEAEEMIIADPSLLLEKGKVKDYSGRTIEGGALGMALGAEDVSNDESQCDLVLIQPPVELAHLTAIYIRNLNNIKSTAYVRCADQLFYLDKVNDNCMEIKLERSVLKQFDAEMKLQFGSRALSKDERQRITLITCHDHHEEMTEMIQRHLRNQFANGEEIIAAQIVEQFPESFEEKEKERVKQDLKALKEVVEAILHSQKEADCGEAITKFRKYLEPKGVVKTGKHFNVQLLVEAFKLYDRKPAQFSGWKSNLFWQKVIGYIQRYLPACYAQAFCQGIYYIVEGGEKLRRSFQFRHDDVVFFPLDSDPDFRLGDKYGAGTAGFVPGGARGCGWSSRCFTGCVGVLQTMTDKKYEACKNIRSTPRRYFLTN